LSSEIMSEGGTAPQPRHSWTEAIQKSTPSKQASQFQGTPARQQGTATAGSPLLWNQGTPHPASPVPVRGGGPNVSFAPMSPPVLPAPRGTASPMALAQKGLALPPFIIGSPTRSSQRRLSGPSSWQASTPLYAGSRSPSGTAMFSPSSGSGVSCCSSNQGPSSWVMMQKSSPACSSGAVATTPVTGISTPSKIVTSTPSKIISISTPLRPCSRQKYKELQDDVKAAVEEQSFPLLRAALQRRHCCSRDHALHEAVRQGNAGAVRLLLQHRVDPNAQCTGFERGCEFPVHMAVSSSFLRAADRIQIVEMLLKAGALTSPRRSDPEGNTPLHDAVRRGDLEVAHLLLRHLADPNATNGFGEVPLELALRGAMTDFLAQTTASHAMVEALLQAGACPWISTDSLASRIELEADPNMRDLLARWSSWWRCRVLAWIRSRGSGHPLCHMMPEILVQVSKFL